jgi:hypothetical protein
MKEERVQARAPGVLFFSRLLTCVCIYIYIIKREAQAPRLYFSVNCLLESTATLLAAILQLLGVPAQAPRVNFFLLVSYLYFRQLLDITQNYLFLAAFARAAFLAAVYCFLALLISCCSLLISYITYFLLHLRALHWLALHWRARSLYFAYITYHLITCGLTCCMHYIP